MIAKPCAAALKIVAVYWTLLILGMVTYTSLRLDAFAQLEPVWTGAIGGSALGQLLAAKRYRTWVAMLIVLAIAMFLLPQMPHDLGGKRLWLAFLPASLCGYWSMGDRTSLAAFWFPAMIWMLSILDGTHANALPGREGLVLFAALTALFVVYLRVREERRVALWQTVAPEPIAAAKPAVIVQDRTAVQLASGAWGLLVTGLGFGVTAWLAPLLWQPEINAGGHSTARTLDVAYDTATMNYAATRERQMEMVRRRAATYRPAYESQGSYYVAGSYDGSYADVGSTTAHVAQEPPPKLPCCPIEDDVYTNHVRVKEFLALGRSDEQTEHKPKFACRPCTYAERYPAPARVAYGASDEVPAEGVVVGDEPVQGTVVVGEATLSEVAGGDVVVGDVRGDVVGGDVRGGVVVGGVVGGDVRGGDVRGGDVDGGDVAVGDVAVGDVAVGDVVVGDIARGDVRGGDVARGDVRGGDVARGDVRGGDIARGDVRGGDVARGDVRGGDVARGDANSRSMNTASTNTASTNTASTNTASTNTASTNTASTDTASTKSDSDAVATRPKSDSSSSFLHWIVLLTAALFTTQLIALALRPLRRAIALRHLRRPYWQETVDQRISNSWQLVLVALRDAGWRADSSESPRELAKRVGIAGVERCATILDRARHGIRIDREDLDNMTATADEAYRDARKQVHGVGRAATWLRWPLV